MSTTSTTPAGQPTTSDVLTRIEAPVAFLPAAEDTEVVFRHLDDEELDDLSDIATAMGVERVKPIRLGRNFILHTDGDYSHQPPVFNAAATLIVAATTHGPYSQPLRVHGPALLTGTAGGHNRPLHDTEIDSLIDLSTSILPDTHITISD
ncbi:hypothetical protein [Haloglycomyces albus]|uniref:hypothetical protein n=1 Tax=Haloglycomyces albus TaxID=526067 RepID=UPI00046CDBA6|nr:hypothetical protein [Haloglycomyces albus]